MPGSTATLDFRAEVSEYDRLAKVARWSGPRYRMTYRILGDGPPLVLVPGLASTYRTYAPTLHRLARQFQTVTIDYPGENADDGSRLGAITHDDLVDDLFGLIDHLSFDRAHLFGLSFGSTLSLRALHREPGRFGPSALQGGFAHRRLRLAERLALAVGRRFRGETSRLPFHDRGLKLKNRDTFPAGMDDRWSYYVEQNGRTSIAGLTHRLDLLDRLDLRPILPKIRQPILLLHGTEDRIVPLARFDELAAMLPEARPVLMPSAGHQPHFTHPEELANLVGDFCWEG